MLSADEFRETIRQQFADNADVLNNLGEANTNWQDEIYRVAVSTFSGLRIPLMPVLSRGTPSTTIKGSLLAFIEEPKGDVLVFSFIGFKPQNVTVTNQQTLNIRLEEDQKQLQEVVVIGYEENSRRNRKTKCGFVCLCDFIIVNSFFQFYALYTEKRLKG